MGVSHHALGLLIRTAGESSDAARADPGYSVLWISAAVTMVGGFLAGIGGSFLSLFYPGSWNEGLSSGQGITAVALVIFARWDPMLCLWASLAFGGALSLLDLRSSRSASPPAIICSTPRPTS